MAARKNSNTAGVDPAYLERVKKLVKEHEDNGRTDTYWHGILARLGAAQVAPEKTKEQESDKDSEVNDGSSN